VRGKKKSHRISDLIGEWMARAARDGLFGPLARLLSC
jgi:hypothetical protein